MKRLKPFKFMEDARGSFTGLLNRNHWEEINYIETAAGQVRGGHYHKEIVEIFFILEGEIEVTIRKMENEEVWKFIARKGDLFMVEPNEIHTFKTTAVSKWINILSKKIVDAMPDFFIPSEK